MSANAASCSAGFTSPSLSLLCWEPLRAALEYTHMRCASKTSTAPRGDGHPVVIFPGLGTDRRSTAPLKDFCERQGYAAFDWGRGFNTGPDEDVDAWLHSLADEVCELSRDAKPISLVGWSLGGIYAREVAKLVPDRVRQVITIGTPFSGTAEHTNVGRIYRLLNGRAANIDEQMQARLRTCPPVPTTSIYSRSDGVVAWQACLQVNGHKRSENIEVRGSHCGLGWNPSVLQIVEDRLAQPRRKWRAYRTTD